MFGRGVSLAPGRYGARVRLFYFRRRRRHVLLVPFFVFFFLVFRGAPAPGFGRGCREGSVHAHERVLRAWLARGDERCRKRHQVPPESLPARQKKVHSYSVTGHFVDVVDRQMLSKDNCGELSTGKHVLHM